MSPSKVIALSLDKEEGRKVAGATESYEVEVEIGQLDGIKAVELEVEKNVSDGEVIEVTRTGGRLEEG